MTKVLLEPLRICAHLIFFSDNGNENVVQRQLFTEFEDSFSVDVEDCRSLHSVQKSHDLVIPSNAADSAEQAVLQFLEKGIYVFIM